MNARNPLVNLFSKTFDRPSDLLCCAFGLKTSEIDVYITLLAGPSSIKDIAQKIDVDRTTVLRALKNLQKLKLVSEPERKTLEHGGYYDEYQAVSASDVRSQLLNQLEHWYKRTRKFLLERWASEIE